MMKANTSSSLSLSILVLGLLWMCLLASAHAQGQQQAPGALPNQLVLGLVNAIRAQGFNTAALIITYVRDVVRPPVTLLIPNDQAIANVALSLPPLSASPSLLRSLVQAHMVPSNLSFSDLQALPVNTLIPTFHTGTRLRITSNTRNDYMIENAHVLGKDICPNIADFLTCFGISQVFNVSGLFPNG